MQIGNLMFINNALIEEVSCSNDFFSEILISYAVRENNNMDSIQTLRLNLNQRTLVLDESGQSICLCCLRRGMWADVIFSSQMTMSIPPMANAFLVAVQRNLQPSLPPQRPTPPQRPMPPSQRPAPPQRPMPPSQRPTPPQRPMPPSQRPAPPQRPMPFPQWSDQTQMPNQTWESGQFPMPERMQDSDRFQMPNQTQESGQFPMPERMEGSDRLQMPEQMQDPNQFRMPERNQNSGQLQMPERI